MVIVFRPTVPAGFEWAIPLDDEGAESIRALGESRADNWRPVRVRILRRLDDGTALLRTSMPWFGNRTLVLKDEAVEALGERLARSGDLLPLACDDADLWLFHARRFVDCLDVQRSSAVTFADGRIMRLTHPVFDLDRVGDHEIFKIPQMPRGSLFLLGGLVDAIRAAGMTGTDFEVVS